MEALAAFSLVGLGYLVTKLSKNNEGFETQQPLLTRQEQGNSARGSNPELDLRYATPIGQIYPSEPNPGPHGNAFSFGGTQLPQAKTVPTPELS